MKEDLIGVSAMALIILAIVIGPVGCASYDSLPSEHAVLDAPSPKMLRAQASHHAKGSVRRAKSVHIKAHPRCAFCGIKGNIVNGNRNDVHHLLPISFRPDLGDAAGNLITACRFCHYSYCHLSNWSTYNPFAAAMAVKILAVSGQWRRLGSEEFDRLYGPRALTADE